MSEQTLVEFVPGKTLRQFAPMIETAGACLQFKPQVSQTLSVALTLRGVEPRNSRSRLCHTLTLEQFAYVNLRCPGHTTHAKGGVIPEDLNMIPGRNGPTNSHAGHLQPFGCRANDENVGLIYVVDVLESTFGLGIAEKLIRFIDQGTTVLT